MDKTKIKPAIIDTVDRHKAELIELSLFLHQNPELAFAEHKSAALLSAYLENNGFKVERGIASLETAFRGVYGSGKPVIAVLAEYDALPVLGHACGHNVIAGSAMGAAIAAKLAVDAFGGTLVVLGTPGEEVQGGKVIMAEQGVFAGLDAAMMTHPARHDTAVTEALAAIGLKIEFFGKAAHAASDPVAGINALEALILGYNAVNALRQHIPERARIHGIITSGGAAPNIVPDYAAASFLVRATDRQYLDILKEKVLDCFRGAAIATGARLEYSWDKHQYDSMKNNLVMARLFAANLSSLGRRVEPLESRHGLGSTDMGNVSQVLPSIHGSVAIAPQEVPEHSEGFAAAAGSEAGHKGLLDAAKAMAMTVADLLADPAVIQKLQQEFRS